MLFSNIPQYSQKNSCVEVGLQRYQKETPTQVFFCEYCKIFKSSYFEEHVQAAAS